MAAVDDLNQAGTPNPTDERRQRFASVAIFPDGGTVTNGVAISAYVPVAGAPRVRLRGKFSVAGTLSFAFTRQPPIAGTLYTLGNPPNIAVAAATEFRADISTSGESVLKVTFTPSNTGTCTYFDAMQLRLPNAPGGAPDTIALSTAAITIAPLMSDGVIGSTVFQVSSAAGGFSCVPQIVTDLTLTAANVQYVNLATGAVSAAGTALTANGIYAVFNPGCAVVLNVTAGTASASVNRVYGRVI